MSWVEQRHADADALAAAVADRLATATREAIAARGRAIFALAGGRTPFPAYRRFAALDLPWPRVHLIATDERCVPHDHPASNTRELRAAFEAARGVGITPLTAADGDPDASLREARQKLAYTAEPFDAVVLGMGADGHTASLFPGAAQLMAALADDAEDAYRIDPLPLPPEAPFPRISLSSRRLLHSRQGLLAISGEAKLAVLQAAQRTADPLRLPISALLHAAPTLEIHWSPG